MAFSKSTLLTAVFLSIFPLQALQADNDGNSNHSRPQLRLSAEGGISVKVTAYEPYGNKARVLLVRAGLGPLPPLLPNLSFLTFLPDLQASVTAVQWSGPYSDSSLLGAGLDYSFFRPAGYFVRLGMGLYYGEPTFRTATWWSAGLNLIAGLPINGDKNEIFASFWHFSNGDKLGLSKSNNYGEEFVTVGISMLFESKK